MGSDLCYKQLQGCRSKLGVRSRLGSFNVVGQSREITCDAIGSFCRSELRDRALLGSLKVQVKTWDPSAVIYRQLKGEGQNLGSERCYV